MINLSVNVNKIALIRNSRGSNSLNLYDFCEKIITYGAKGITIHPRPDARHITLKDALYLKKIIKPPYELNIELNPLLCNKKFFTINATQFTFVPDHNNYLTSNHGWDVKKYKSDLVRVVKLFPKNSRKSIFVNPTIKYIPLIKEIGFDRIEIFTGPFAKKFLLNNYQKELEKIKKIVELAKKYELGVNCGHDLDLKNLTVLIKKVHNIDEVSIGHSIIVDALTNGYKKTINDYINVLKIK
jgi:pyridoxine 5-phosphate synthase